MMATPNSKQFTKVGAKVLTPLSTGRTASDSESRRLCDVPLDQASALPPALQVGPLSSRILI
jgi:hypothetical protein